MSNFENSADFSTFGKRLKHIMGTEWSEVSLAKELSKARNTISNYMEDQTVPQIDTVQKIAEICKVDPVWLFLGEQRAENRIKNTNSSRENGNDYFEIPILDITASAGYGLLSIDHPNCETVRISKDFFEEHLRYPPVHAFIISISGDSMEPTIHSGAKLFLDTRQTMRLEGVYAFTMGGDIYVKRLHKLLDQLIIMSDNQLYEKMTAPIENVTWNKTASDDQIGIIGKVSFILQPCL